MVFIREGNTMLVKYLLDTRLRYILSNSCCGYASARIGENATLIIQTRDGWKMQGQNTNCDHMASLCACVAITR